jgi:epoxyqueuosine reductase
LSASTTSDLSAFVKEQALAAGFDLAGITTPDAPPHIKVYEHWLDAGRHGQMSYMAKTRARAARRDPLHLLPECRSILVVAANYSGSEQDPPGEARPRVAAYARGDDYHDVLKDRLRRVVERVEARLGASFPYRIYVDTGPLLERELAQRAGLGWIGKNTCLINPQMGSYILLGEVLLGLDLEPDPPLATDHCGTCTRCVEACPTDCILPDRTIDARRCISYLTIELRGQVPIDLRDSTGDWVFGCDVCQQVCPWNLRFARATSDTAFQTRPFIARATLQSLLRLDRDTYVEGLRRSPLKRAKLAGLKRNAALAAGNRGTPELVPALIDALDDSEPDVRKSAAWALGRIGGAAAEHALADRLDTEGHPGVKDAFRSALARATNT